MEGECKICKNYKDHYFGDHTDGKGIEFYELMKGDFSQQLRIPKKFTDYCKRLPLTVDLKGPSGSILPVELHRTSDEVTMLHGWKKFVKAHGVQERDLLLFKYDGKFCLHVSIFDGSQCKKAPFEFFAVNKPEKEHTSRDSVEILNVKSREKVTLCSSSSSSHEDFLQLTTNRKARTDYHRTDLSCKEGRNEFPVSIKNKKLKQYVDDQDTRDKKIHESVEIRNGGKVTESDFFLREFSHLKIYMSRSKHLSGEEKKRLLQLVDAVQPKNPCFISFMIPGNVSDGYFVDIPAGFKEHLPSTNCAMFLRVPHERTKWRVSLFAYKTMTRFCWESFVLDNRLHVEDICLFELIEDELDITMIVHIHRSEGLNNSGSSSSDGIFNKTTKNREAPWPSVTRKSRSNGCSSFGCTKKFCTTGYIRQEGDGFHNSKKLTYLNIYMPGRLTKEEEKKALFLIGAVVSKNPRFITFMGPHNVGSNKSSKRTELSIPLHFAKECLPNENSRISLQLPSSRAKWCVNYSWSNIQSRFRSGWRHFVLANNLKQGDACVFELRKRHPSIKMTVHIFPAATK